MYRWDVISQLIPPDYKSFNLSADDCCRRCSQCSGCKYTHILQHIIHKVKGKVDYIKYYFINYQWLTQLIIIIKVEYLSM